MALTVTLERQERVGSIKLFIFKVVDDDGTTQDIDLSDYLSHIHNIHLQNMTGTTWKSAIWADLSDTITLGAEGSGDTFKLSVWGS